MNLMQIVFLSISLKLTTIKLPLKPNIQKILRYFNLESRDFHFFEYRNHL